MAQAMQVPDNLSDPLDLLTMERTKRCIAYEPFPIIWIIGKTWVVDHGGDNWLIGPDEPATSDEVRALLVASDYQYELQEYIVNS